MSKHDRKQLTKKHEARRKAEADRQWAKEKHRENHPELYTHGDY